MDAIMNDLFIFCKMHAKFEHSLNMGIINDLVSFLTS
jgi:hypothetical protein